MNSKLPYEKIHNFFLKSYSKFVFLTKKFKGKTSVMFLKLFLNAMIGNIKIHNILHIMEISKSMEPNKFIQKIVL